MDITIGRLASWIFGAIFIVGGLGAMTQSVIGGIVLALTGVFLVPNVREMISDQYDLNFSRWVVVLIVLLGLGISSAMMPTNAPSTATQPDQTGSQPSGDSQDTEPSYTIGDTVSAGSLSFRADRSGRTDVIGGQFSSTEASGEFIIVAVTVRNDGNDPVMITSNNFEVRDPQGRTFDVSTEASIDLDVQGVDTFTFEELNPGLQKSGALAFDVPADAENLELIVSEGAFGASEEIDIGSVSDFEPF